MPGHTNLASRRGSGSSLVLAVEQARQDWESVSQSLSDKTDSQPVWEHPPAVASSLSPQVSVSSSSPSPSSSVLFSQPALSLVIVTNLSLSQHLSRPRYTLGRLLHRPQGWIDEEEDSRMEQTATHPLRNHRYPQTAQVHVTRETLLVLPLPLPPLQPPCHRRLPPLLVVRDLKVSE